MIAEVLCSWTEEVKDGEPSRYPHVQTVLEQTNEKWKLTDVVGKNVEDLPSDPNMVIVFVDTTSAGLAAIDADTDCTILWSE